jgi:hypothetical protein
MEPLLSFDDGTSRLMVHAARLARTGARSHRLHARSYILRPMKNEKQR